MLFSRALSLSVDESEEPAPNRSAQVSVDHRACVFVNNIRFPEARASTSRRWALEVHVSRTVDSFEKSIAEALGVGKVMLEQAACVVAPFSKQLTK